MFDTLYIESKPIYCQAKKMRTSPPSSPPKKCEGKSLSYKRQLTLSSNQDNPWELRPWAISQ